MTLKLVRLSFVLLIGVIIYFVEETSGEKIKNKTFLSAPTKKEIEKLSEGVSKFNIVKRETLRQPKAGKKNGNESTKKGKNKKNHGIRKQKQRNNAGNKAKSLKKGKGKNKQRRKNGPKNKNKQIKRRKLRNKEANKKTNTKSNSMKKNKHMKISKYESKERSKNGKMKKNAGKKNKSRKRGKGAVGKVNPRRRRKSRQCDANCAEVSASIKTYRMYLNHDRKINRTKGWISKLVGKSSTKKLEKFEEDAVWLEKVTNNGTDCPGNNTNHNKELVISVTAGLKACAGDTGPIATLCNKSVIPNVVVLEEKQNECQNKALKPPPYTSYQGWIDGFTKCFTTNQTCACFAVMNGANNNLPNIPPHSCKFPNKPSPDWIIAFNKATNVALRNCQQAVQACKALERQACHLTSMCCKNSADGGTATTENPGNMTTAGTGRRMKIKASMIKQLKKFNIH